MIVLTSTFTLELILSAGTADVDVSYVDRTATAYPIGATQQTAATATTQTICSAPAASTSREIDFMSVKIKTTGGVVTVQKLNSSGAVVTQLISVTLLDEEVLTYTHGSGWAALDANGNRKEVTSTLFASLTVTGNATVAGDFGIAATKKIYLDGIALTGDTYISETSGNTLSLVAGGNTSLQAVSAGIIVSGTAGGNILRITSSGGGDGMIISGLSAGSGASFAAVDSTAANFTPIKVNGSTVTFGYGGSATAGLSMSNTGVITFNAYTATTFVAGDKYLVVNASGVIHVSALGPAS